MKTSKHRVIGLCEGINRWPVNSPHKGPVTRKMLPFGDVIMCGLIWDMVADHYLNQQRFIAHTKQTVFHGKSLTLDATRRMSHAARQSTVEYQTFNSQKVPHTSPSRASYGVLFVSIRKKRNTASWNTTNLLQSDKQMYDKTVEIQMYRAISPLSLTNVTNQSYISRVACNLHIKGGLSSVGDKRWWRPFSLQNILRVTHDTFPNRP